MLLAVVLLVVWIVLQVLDRGGDTTSKAVPTATATTEAPVAAPTDGKVQVDLTAGNAACNPQKVLVAPSIRPGQFTGAPVNVTMSVSTTDAKACVLDAKAADLLVVISANKKPVWDSSVCKSALLTGPVAISANWATVVETTWTGRGSGQNCSPKEGFAAQGSYVIKSATLGGEIGKSSFRIENQPKPKATKATPTTKPSSKKPSAKPGAKATVKPAG